MFITLAMSLYILVMYQCTIQKWFHVLFERSPYACVVSVGLREEIRSVEISVSSKWCTLKVLKIGKKVSHRDSYNRMALEIFKDMQPVMYASTHLQLATGCLCWCILLQKVLNTITVIYHSLQAINQSLKSKRYFIIMLINGVFYFK